MTQVSFHWLRFRLDLFEHDIQSGAQIESDQESLKTTLARHFIGGPLVGKSRYF